MMKQDNSDLESIVQQYVLKTLSEADNDAFEERLFDDPEILEMVKIAQTINIGVENSTLRKPAAVSSGEGSRSEDSYWRNRGQADVSPVATIKSWLTWPMPAYAPLAFAILLAPLLWKVPYSSANLEMINFSTAVTRSGSNQPLLDLTLVKSDAAVVIKLAEVDYPYYKMELYSLDADQPSWTSKPFAVGNLRERLVVVPHSVERQAMKMRVVGLSGDSAPVPVSFCHISEACR